ncbi:hypothetical protein BC628DRAFT_1298684, partial [Trametes gibbosa]
MPRFLNTSGTGTFEWHDHPRKLHYAILSHTWRALVDGGEQTHADISKLKTEVIRSMQTVPGFREGCEFARNAPFELFWIDEYCNDKTSSADLAEAISSMYERYRLSDICFFYLEDVRDGDVPQAKHSKFRASRWHTR